MGLSEDEAKDILSYIASRFGYDGFKVQQNNDFSNHGICYLLFLHKSKDSTSLTEIVVRKQYGLSQAFHAYAFNSKPSQLAILNAMLKDVASKTYEPAIRRVDNYGWQPLLKCSDTLYSLKVEADLQLKSFNLFY